MTAAVDNPSGPASDSALGGCRLIRPAATYDGKQGFRYFEGVAAETVGAKGLCMHLLVIPPGGRAKAHRHLTHETAIYVLEGSATMWHGERLEERMETRAGDMVFIPANVPHLPVNTGTIPCRAVIARTDPHEQESVDLLPALDGLVPA